MTHITIEQLERRKQELIRERDWKLERIAVGYDNAIAELDNLIKMAVETEDGQDEQD